MMQSFAITCIVTIVWIVAGYSLAFTNGSAYIGDLSRFMLHGIAAHISKGVDTGFILGAGTDGAAPQTIPETVYMMFQMTFAIITPALICRRLRRSHEVLRAVHLHDAVVVADLLADRALGVGADRLDRQPGRAGLRRRHGGAHQRRHRRADDARWCWASGSATARRTWRRTTWPTR